MTQRSLLGSAAVLLTLAAGCSRTPIDESPRRDAEVQPPPYTGFPRVSVGVGTSCVLEANGHGLCWGNTLNGLMQPPNAPLVALDMGGLYGCGLLADGTPRCWPGNNHPTPTSVPDAKFRKVSVGSLTACGIRLDEGLVCWGNPKYALTDPPQGRFRDVSTGDNHACAVKTDGTAVCWGLNVSGQANAPGGYFLSVYAGTHHSCGLIDGELIRCWGYDLFGSLQDRRVRALALGDHATCAILLDGSVECAGDSELQTKAPSGKFEQIDLGSYHGCGVRPGGAIECWGLNADGQATPPSR